jgi:hypothetical protein
MLHLTEDEAIKQFEVLLNQTSVLTAVFDVIHDWCVNLVPGVDLIFEHLRSLSQGSVLAVVASGGQRGTLCKHMVLSFLFCDECALACKKVGEMRM